MAASTPTISCQIKGCEAYGKSTARDKLEDEVGEIIRPLEPTTGLITLVSAIFRRGWNARREQAQEMIRSGRRQLLAIDKEIGKLLDRIMGASNASVIQAYETKLGDLERSKALLAEKLENQAEPKGGVEEKLEPALTFLANP